MDCPKDKEKEFASKLSEVLPDLAPLLKEHGVLERFTVNLGVDLSEFASPHIDSKMSCCLVDGKWICSLTYPTK